MVEFSASQTSGPKSRMIPLLCAAYCLAAAAGLFLTMLGQMSKPDPLPMIDKTGDRSESLEQAERILEKARQQKPDNSILNTFYKGWLLEFDYEDLVEYTEPMFDEDSFERRLNGYNSTVVLVEEIFEDALVTLALLSSGGLILAMLMLRAPNYMVSLLLGAYPVAVLFLCASLGINADPLGALLAPFIVLGALVFLLQAIFSFRFGRPVHRTVEGLPGLIDYRRGLVTTNLGLFLLIGGVLMATGSISGPVRSLRAIRGLALFGEGGIVLIGFLVGSLLVFLGVRDLNRKPRGQVDSTSS